MARNTRKTAKKLPAKVPVATNKLVRDWKEKLALEGAFKELKKAMGTQPDLELPIQRVQKQVDILLDWGMFRTELKKLGLKKR